MPNKKTNRNRKKKGGGGAAAETDEPICYRCEELPNKGMGMLAARNIACGETVLEVNTRSTRSLL